MKNISRRLFVQSAAAMAAGTAGMAMPIFTQDDWWHRWNMATDPQAKGLSAYLNHGNLFIRYYNQPLLNYRAYQDLKYPYFSPLSGPISGLPLTTESGLPYPHHRGLWLGCEPLEGGDYWGDSPLSRGHIRSTNLQLHESDDNDVVRFSDSCEWIRENAESPLEDRRRFEVTVKNRFVRLLDCHFAITARRDITIERAKHAFFAIRCSPDIAPTYGGTLINSHGDPGAKGTYGKPAKWCTYFGRRQHRPDLVEGIAIMDHPENFNGSCPWFTRDYGHMSPQPFEFLKDPFRMGKGETLDLRYRIVLYTGTPDQARLDSLYDEWI